MNTYQWLGVLILVGLLVTFIAHEGRELGYAFTLLLLGAIVVGGIVVAMAFALIFKAIS